ncbi:MAG: SDR family oxidoreductase [Leptospiraceae bacterium]|nr:SDR family oxidoreductase [Leptospiraceae bacterium]
MKEPILIAGATGYLGRFVLTEAARRGYPVRAIARTKTQITTVPAGVELRQAALTQPATIQDLCTGIDTVFSSVGITRQKDGLSYMAVDYQANLNLLQAAIRAKVRRFMYISALHPQFFIGNPMMTAKERFCQALDTAHRQQQIEAIIVRPTGFFSDIKEFYTMAQSGRVYLIGNGQNEINPIHGADLAAFCMDVLERPVTAMPTTILEGIAVGGPRIFRQNEIAALAFQIVQKPERITRVPHALGRMVLQVLRPFSQRLFTIGDFITRGAAQDMVAPLYGHLELEDFFRDLQTEAATSRSPADP